MNPEYYKDRADDFREFEYKYGKKYTEQIIWEESTEYILDKIDIREIEQYLRKKKLEKINNEQNNKRWN